MAPAYAVRCKRTHKLASAAFDPSTGETSRFLTEDPDRAYVYATADYADGQIGHFLPLCPDGAETVELWRAPSGALVVCPLAPSGWTSVETEAD